jgi:hypothetical protein
MAEDGLDIVDVETSILNGNIIKSEKDDPRGKRHTVHDWCRPRHSGWHDRSLTETGQYLIITVYEVTDG